MQGNSILSGRNRTISLNLNWNAYSGGVYLKSSAGFSSSELLVEIVNVKDLAIHQIKAIKKLY